MANEAEVEAFLRDFKQKMEVQGYVTRGRKKNLQSLSALNIVPFQQKEFLSLLKVEDYMSGPTEDTEMPSQPDYYVFGIQINSTDVYIKISMGQFNKPVDVISFHVSERANHYPFK